MFRRAVMDQLQRKPQRMIIDLDHVAFLGMAGISELLDVCRLGQDRTVDVVLVASHDSLLRTLEITGIADLFTIHPTIRDALSEP
jgi:anti-sigma B factor antagonist